MHRTDATPDPLLAARRRRARLGIAALALALASGATLVLACGVGPLPIPLAEVGSILTAALTGQPYAGDPVWPTVVLELRLSRAVLAWLTGAALALSGCVFQGLLRNPLADPFTLGVSSGAAFGASLAIYLGAASATAGLAAGLKFGLLPLAGLAGAALSLAAVIGLARTGGSLRRETMVLAGIVTATFLAALISLLKSLDEESVSAIVFWIMGSFQGRGTSHLLLFCVYFVPGCLLVAARARDLDLLAMGETQARHLGLNAARSRLALLIGAGLLTGASVAVAGVIGFVGLVAPHLVRMLAGAEHRPLCLLSALGGGIALTLSDTLARSVLPGGAELPVGVVTALAGGPFFCWLLRRNVREARS